MGAVTTSRVKKHIKKTGLTLSRDQWYKKTVKKFIRRVHWEAEKCWDGVFQEMLQECGYPLTLSETNNYRRLHGLPERRG